MKLKPEHHLPSMGTTHQYLLVTAAPEKQEAFDALKREHGSCFAFHGSPIENWHAILREGLKNMSGGQGQLHGAAYGAGVYLASNGSTSFGYCHHRDPSFLAAAKKGRKAKNAGAEAGPGATSSGADPMDPLWINPDKQGMYCLALCETINHGIQQHGWYCYSPPPPPVPCASCDRLLCVCCVPVCGQCVRTARESKLWGYRGANRLGIFCNRHLCPKACKEEMGGDYARAW